MKGKDDLGRILTQNVKTSEVSKSTESEKLTYQSSFDSRRG